MTNFSRYAWFAVLILVLMAGCTSTSPTSNPPAAPLPVSSQITILQADKALADAVNAAVHGVIALRDQGKVSQADTTEIENYCLPAAKFSDALDTIITTSTANGDTWAVERGKI